MSSPVTPGPPQITSVYRFGQFEFDPGSGELLRNGHAQRLPEQPLRILLALLEQPGEIVSRDTLRERLWPQDTFVDFELGLNAAMKRLRRALHDDAINPRFIETLPRRGYRFLAPVSVPHDPLPAEAEEPETPVPDDEELEPQARADNPGTRWTKWIAVASAGVAAGLLLAWLFARPAPPNRAVRRYSIVLPGNATLAPASFMPLGVGRPNLAISRDGEKIAYAGVTGATTQLFVRDHSGAPPRVLPGTEGANSPFFSPDGQWIGFFAESKLKKVRLDGGPAIALCDVALGFGGDWAADDTIYFTPGERSAIYRIPAAGGIPTRVNYIPSRMFIGSLYWPQVLPGGKTLLFGDSRSGIGVLELGSLTAKKITNSGSFPRWSSTGHVLYVDNGVLWALPFDPVRLQPRGAAIVVLDHVRMELQGAAQYDIAADGTLVYAQGGDVAEASFTWVHPSGAVEDAGLPPRRYGEFDLSPDGRILAVIIFDGAMHDLWALDLDRKVLTRLTGDGFAWSPFWSPDGKKLVYGSMSSHKPSLIELSVDGLRKRDILILPEVIHNTGFAPDGKTISISTREGTDRVISLLNVNTGEKQELLRSAYMIVFPTISPDGQWLAYVSDETGRWEVYLRAMQAEAHPLRITTSGGEEPVWDRSSRRVYFRNGIKWMRVEISANPAFRASEPVEVFEGPYVNIPGYSYSLARDGRFLLLKSEYQGDNRPKS